jgi:hypothetical protein
MTHQPTYSQFSQSLQKSYTQMLFYRTDRSACFSAQWTWAPISVPTA